MSLERKAYHPTNEGTAEALSQAIPVDLQEIARNTIAHHTRKSDQWDDDTRMQLESCLAPLLLTLQERSGGRWNNISSVPDLIPSGERNNYRKLVERPVIRIFFGLDTDGIVFIPPKIVDSRGKDLGATKVLKHALDSSIKLRIKGGVKIEDLKKRPPSSNRIRLNSQPGGQFRTSPRLID